MATPNGTMFQVATDAAFTTKLIDYTGAYETSHTPAAGVLTKGIPLYARVKHSSVESGYSAWSATRQFSIVNILRYIHTVKDDTNNTALWGHTNAPSGISYACGGYHRIFGIFTKYNRYTNTMLGIKKCVLASGSYTGVSFEKIVYGGDDYLYAIGTVAMTSDVNNRPFFSVLVKLDTNLNLIWSKFIYCTSVYSQKYHNLVYSATHSKVYVLGAWSDSGTYRQPILIACNTSDGAIAWSKYILTDSQSTAQYASDANGVAPICLDSSGNVYISTCRVAAGYAYLFKFNGSTGATIFSKYINTTVYAGKLVCSSTNNIYLIGFDTSVQPIVIKFNSDGIVQQSTTITGTTAYIWNGGIDGGDNIYLTGTITVSGTVYYGVIIKLNSAGNAVSWCRRLIGSSYFIFTDLSYADNHITASGWFMPSSTNYYRGIVVITPADTATVSGTIPSLSVLSWDTISLGVTANTFATTDITGCVIAWPYGWHTPTCSISMETYTPAPTTNTYSY